MTFLKNILTILLLSAIGAGIGYGVNSLKKEQWQAEVQLEKPRVEQLGTYYSLSSMYQTLTEDKTTEKDTALLVYSAFKKQAQSYDHLQTFWQNQEFYKQRQTNMPERDAALLQELIENTKFIAGDEGQHIPDSIQITLDNPKQAVEVLANFVDYTSSTAKSVLYNELIIKWKNLFNQINLAVKANQNNSSQDAENWSAKLNMMKSVSPLDDKLVAYYYIKSPTQPIQPVFDGILWIAAGAGIGLLFGLLFIFLRKKK
ncbi:chain-length determining protein [Pasteurellaceae bacterium 22721_9_1]